MLSALLLGNSGQPSEWSVPSYVNMLGIVQELSSRRFSCDWAQAEFPFGTIHLRHDVDFSLEPAVKMASAERDVGVRSTYFGEIVCTFYNVLSAASRGQIHEISAMGHQVGLHLVLPDPREGIAVDALNSQLRTLVSVAPEALTNIVSLHQPNRFGRVPPELPIATTYDAKFFDSSTYLSDSAGEWGGSMTKWIDNIVATQLPAQLLIHPLWWVEPGDTPRHKLERLLGGIHSAAEIELAQFRAWHLRGHE